MENNRRTKRIAKIILGQLGVIFIMVSLALSITFYAQGYRFNYLNFKIIKTGVLYLVSYPKGSTVIIDGKEKADKTPFSSTLRPGVYNVLVKKEGYYSWYNSVKIEPELVSNFKNIFLISKNIPVTALTDQRKIDLLNSPIDFLAVREDSTLAYNDFEIWANDNLVTRFSKPIQRAIWYSDHEHIVFQQGKEIRIMDLDGSNDILLVELSSPTETRFNLNSKGTELYFVDNGEYKVAALR